MVENKGKQWEKKVYMDCRNIIIKGPSIQRGASTIHNDTLETLI